MGSSVMEPLNPLDRTRSDGARQHGTGVLRHRGRGAAAVRGEAQATAGAVQGQAPLAGRSCADGASHRRARCRSTNTTRSRSSLGRCAGRCRRSAAARLRAARRALPARFPQTIRAPPRRCRRHLRSAVHRRLSRALPVQPLRARASARSARSCSRPRRHRHRSRRQPLLRPDRLLRRQPSRQRLLQGVHGARRSPACRSSGRCSAPIIR